MIHSTASPTTTIYTGTYNNTIAKRSPMHYKRRAFASTSVSVSRIEHIYGNASPVPIQQPYEVDCLVHVTSTTTTTITTHIAFSTAVACSASKAPPSNTSTASPTDQPATTTTLTLTLTQAINSTAAATRCTTTTTTVGSATATTTQHLKCAPSNLISAVNGHGIGQTQGQTFGLAPGSDPSACCQLCLDTPGCAASEDDPKAGNCLLWSTSGPACGLGLQYSDGGRGLLPGQGYFVQSGCGTVAAE